MARKTVKVEELKNMVNEMLQNGDDRYGADTRTRQGSIYILENILHDTGNYHGYRHLRPSEVPPGNKPGIAVECVDGTTIEQRFPADKVDSTRVHYF